MGLLDRKDPKEFVLEWEITCKGLYPKAGLLPGIDELVSGFESRNVPMAICTSSNSSAVEVKRLYHQDLFSKMKVVVTGDDPSVKEGKPAPDIFLEGARRLGVDPTKCLVFEDSPFVFM